MLEHFIIWFIFFRFLTNSFLKEGTAPQGENTQSSFSIPPDSLFDSLLTRRKFASCRFNNPSILVDLGIVCQLILTFSFLPSVLQRFFFCMFLAFFIGDYFLFKMSGIRLRPALLSFFPDISTFHQSIPWKTHTFFIASTFLGWVIVQFLPQISFPNLLIAALFGLMGLFPFLFSHPTERSNLVFLWESDLITAIRRFAACHFQRREYTTPPSKTLTPEEKRRFHLKMKPGETPHVIFLFLESFRAKNVGSLGCPDSLSLAFDKWSKQGILFTQFHSNGLLTSTAMISSLHLCLCPPG